MGLFKEKGDHMIKDLDSLKTIEGLTPGDRIVYKIDGGCEFLPIGSIATVTKIYDETHVFIKAKKEGILGAIVDSRYFEKEVQENEKETT